MARLIAEESDLRSSTAPLRATLVQSTQEHHLKKRQGRVRGHYLLLVNDDEEEIFGLLILYGLYC